VGAAKIHTYLQGSLFTIIIIKPVQSVGRFRTSSAAAAAAAAATTTGSRQNK